MASAIYDTKTISVDCKEYNFKANGQTLRFKGYMAVYIETEEKGIGECIIAKQRNGPVGTVKMAWIGAHSKFADLDLVHKE